MCKLHFLSLSALSAAALTLSSYAADVPVSSSPEGSGTAATSGVSKDKEQTIPGEKPISGEAKPGSPVVGSSPGGHGGSLGATGAVTGTGSTGTSGAASTGGSGTTSAATDRNATGVTGGAK